MRRPAGDGTAADGASTCRVLPVLSRWPAPLTDNGCPTDDITAEAAMKIGVLGSGVVAQTLAGGFLKHGHEVTIGTREPAKLAEWAENESRRRASRASGTRRGSARSWSSP